MDRCPHCGKTLRPEAESCPYCGSDFETGWNPDADYYNLDLPTDEEEFPPREQAPSTSGVLWNTIGGLCTVALAGAFFLVVTQPILAPQNLVMVVVLVLSLWFFLVKTKDDWQKSL